jgi:hypothetical protein
MRTVTIVHDRANLRPWVAVEQLSGNELLRLRDRDELHRICLRLGWQVATAQSPGKATKPANFKRALRHTSR